MADDPTRRVVDLFALAARFHVACDRLQPADTWALLPDINADLAGGIARAGAAELAEIERTSRERLDGFERSAVFHRILLAYVAHVRAERVSGEDSGPRT